MQPREDRADLERSSGDRPHRGSRSVLTSGRPSGAGEGTDRKIEKGWVTPKRIVLAGAALLFLGLIGYGFARTSGGTRLNVEREKLTLATVQEAPFQERIAVSGTVMPRTTVYLDVVEGGRVEEVYVREGALLQEGDPLLRLSNSDLQMRLLSSEAALTEQEGYLQNMRFQIEQNRLSLRQQLLQMDYEIQRLRREHERNRELFEKRLISEQEFERVRDELAYWEGRKGLTEQSYRQDSLAQAARLSQMQGSVDRMRRNFGLLQATLENLMVRAPVSGHLTALDAELGEILSRGTRLGQVDVLDGGSKVRAAIDEFYIERIFPGQAATTQPLSGETYRMEVTRVYPEVREGRFEVDLEFEGDVPEGLRRGQTIRLNLELGDPAEAVIVPRGGFYASTGGQWVFALDPSGEFAVRRAIRLGRQNPEYYEVLEGLAPGERVVTSSYDTFGDADRLVFE